MNLNTNIGTTYANLNGRWIQDPVYPHMLHSSTGYRTTMVGPCSEFTDPGARFIMKRDSSYRWASGPDVSPIEFPQQPMVASATSYGQCFNSAAALPWGNAPTEAPPTQQQQQPDPFTPSNVFNTSSLIEIDWRLIAAAVLVLITILTSRS